MLKSSLKLPKGNELPILKSVNNSDKNKKIVNLAIVISSAPFNLLRLDFNFKLNEKFFSTEEYSLKNAIHIVIK